MATAYYTDRNNSWVIAINGTIVTGETFKAKEFIKGSLGGKWDGNNKVWIIDTNKLAKALDSITGLYDASEAQIAKLTETTTSSKATVAATRRNFTASTHIAVDGVRVCNKCGTVCYGDCEAN